MGLWNYVNMKSKNSRVTVEQIKGIIRWLVIFTAASIVIDRILF